MKPPKKALTPCAISFVRNKLPLHEPKTFNVCRFFKTSYLHDFSQTKPFQLPIPPTTSCHPYESTYAGNFRVKSLEHSHMTEANRRQLSQFSDLDGPGRRGWNTWKDESGIYGNSHFKRCLQTAHDHAKDTINNNVYLNFTE